MAVTNRPANDNESPTIDRASTLAEKTLTRLQATLGRMRFGLLIAGI